MYLATRFASNRLPPEATVPCLSVSALEITRLGSIGVTGMPLAKAVIWASIAAELPGQSGAPPEFCVTQQWRSEEHTSELQSQSNLVCRLLLEKKTTIHDYC